jgi:hypothetical protein
MKGSQNHHVSITSVLSKYHESTMNVKVVRRKLLTDALDHPLYPLDQRETSGKELMPEFDASLSYKQDLSKQHL